MKKLFAAPYLIMAWMFCIIVLIVGCSVDSDPLSSSSSQSDRVIKTNTYPPLAEVDLDQLIPGFTVLKTDLRAPERGENLDDQSSRFIRRTQGGTVTHRNNGVEIPAWVLPSDRTITISTPTPGTAIVDYYPHPLQFQGCVRIWIDLRVVQLPPGRRWDELAFFYQEADGSVTRYWGVLDLGNMTYSAWPDHFSRYILAFPSR